MRAYARERLRRGLRDGGGESDRARHLRQARPGWRASSAAPIALWAAAAHVWRWYLELLPTRPIGPDGPLALTHADIAAWAALTGRRPTRGEVRLLLAADQGLADAWADLARGRTRRG